MPPLRGLIFRGERVLHRCRPYGAKEGFWHIQGFRVVSGSVRKPNLPGLETETVVAQTKSFAAYSPRCDVHHATGFLIFQNLCNILGDAFLELVRLGI